MSKFKINGAFVLCCIETGKEGIVGMDFHSIEEAVLKAWSLKLPSWVVYGIIDDKLKTICEGKYN